MDQLQWAADESGVTVAGATTRLPAGASTAKDCAGPAFVPNTLAELLGATPEQLSQCDIARMNLLCATGLPGAEDVGVEKYLRILDAWTVRIRASVEASRRDFDARPTEYGFSRAYHKMLVLTSVLQKHFGIRYSDEKSGDASWDMPDDLWFRESRDCMIHGLLGKNRSGTCPSLPVLITAVARRLGLPVHLAVAPAHVFCKWDDPVTGEQFNIECHGIGMNSHPDEYYRHWPHRWAPEEREEENHRRLYLRSLSAAESLAEMLSIRGACLRAHDRLDEAADAYFQASILWPTHPMFPHHAREILRRMGIYGFGFPDLRPNSRVYLSAISRRPRAMPQPPSMVLGSWPLPCGVSWAFAPSPATSRIPELHTGLWNDDDIDRQLFAEPPKHVQFVIHRIVRHKDDFQPAVITVQMHPNRRVPDDGPKHDRPPLRQFSRTAVQRQPFV